MLNLSEFFKTILNNADFWCFRFKGESDWFCPPIARRSTNKNEESEKVDKVLSVLGVCYKSELHCAIGHMRRWDGAYPALVNGTKAVDLLAADGQARSIVLA
jgi:hypothetical protein